MTIVPMTELKITASDVTIDGGGLDVVINGGSDASLNGLEIDGGTTTIENLDVTSFFTTQISVNSSNNTIKNNQVPANPLGATERRQGSTSKDLEVAATLSQPMSATCGSKADQRQHNRRHHP